MRRPILALLLPLAAASIAAQGGASDSLPVIEPRLTRIIGADTLQIGGAHLSPSGKWVVYRAESPSGDYLWVISSEGGEPKRLIETEYAGEVKWFPSGDRIAYRSQSFIMTIPFDDELGVASGRPQRVTLDPVAGGFFLSPDGRHFAYRMWGPEGGMIIKVIPSNGGTALTIGGKADMVFLMDWSADGRTIYYRARNRDTPTRPILAAPVDGGPPREVAAVPTGPSGPAIPYRVRRVSEGATEPYPFEIQTDDGKAVARMAAPDGAWAGAGGASLSSDHTRLLFGVSSQSQALRVLPVAGGSPRQVFEGDTRITPLGWSPDGDELLFATSLDGRESMLSVPVTGGAAREIGPVPDRGPLPRDRWAYPVTFSSDGQHLMYSRPNPDSVDRTLVIRPVNGDQDRIVSQSLRYHEAFRLAGPGGTPNVAGAEFLYLERNGEKAELRATSPQGPSRLLRDFPVSDVGRGQGKGVFEDRVAYAHYEGGFQLGLPEPSDPPKILVARGVSGTPKEVASVPGVLAYDDIVWSHDGRWIAATTFFASETGYIKVLVVGVTPEGEVSTAARLIDTPIVGSAWGLRWLPDGSGVTLYGQREPDWGFDIWLVPVRNGGRPVSLTRDEGEGVGLNTLSPDGLFVAYQAFVPGGSSLWIADLGDALNRVP
jgi:Tol biopolymer transport system component